MEKTMVRCHYCGQMADHTFCLDCAEDARMDGEMPERLATPLPAICRRCNALVNGTRDGYCHGVRFHDLPSLRSAR